MTLTPASARARSGRPSVGVDDLQTGMVTAEDVHDPQGRLLVPDGTVLTDRHLRAFQMLGILSLKVRGTGDVEDAVPVISPEILALAEVRIRERMRHHDVTQPAIAEIVKYAIQQEARLLASGERPHA